MHSYILNNNNNWTLCKIFAIEWLVFHALFIGFLVSLKFDDIKVVHLIWKTSWHYISEWASRIALVFMDQQWCLNYYFRIIKISRTHIKNTKPNTKLVSMQTAIQLVCTSLRDDLFNKIENSLRVFLYWFVFCCCLKPHWNIRFL